MWPHARAVMLTNYDDVARFVDLDPYAMIARAGLKPAALINPENWLPAANVLSLIDDSAARSGRDDFGLLLGKCRTFTSLGPISLLLKHEATVREIILASVEYKYLLNDLLLISLRDDGQHAVVEWNLVPGLHSDQGMNLVSAIVYRGVSEALGLNWEPECIHFRHAAPKNVATFKRFFRCALEFDSHFDGLSCSSADLQTHNPFADADLTAYARRLLDLLPAVRDKCAIDRVRSVILLGIEDGQSNVKRVAECLGVQVRTLQRKLADEGESFSDLLNDIRRELAIRYLAGSSHSLAAVAQLVGYSTLSAFTRWFSAEFGIQPGVWRKQKRHEIRLHQR